MTFVLSREAGDDLRQIEDYTVRTWGRDQREKYLGAIFSAFRRLAEQPQLGHPRSDVPTPYLVYGVGSHLIIYRHNAKFGRIEVLNILHPAMQIEKRVLAALKRKGA